MHCGRKYIFFLDTTTGNTHNTSSKMNTKMNVITSLVTLLYCKTCVALLKESQKCTRIEWHKKNIDKYFQTSFTS